MQHRGGWEDVPQDGQQALTLFLVHLKNSLERNKMPRQPYTRLGTDLEDGFSYSSSKRAADNAISCFTSIVCRLTKARLLEEQK